MTRYCEICGAELDPEEEEDGICEECKNSRHSDEDEEEYEKDENYIDPGIT